MKYLKTNSKEPVILISQEREYLRKQIKNPNVSGSLSRRCLMILRCADGFSSSAVAAEFDVHVNTVDKWRARFLKSRIDGLNDKIHPSGRRRIANSNHNTDIDDPHHPPADDISHWSIR